MPEVVLDTNFVMNAVDCKIDFVEELERMGFTCLVPEEVIKELERVVESRKKKKFKEHAELSLKILKASLKDPSVKKIKLGMKGRAYVDRGLVKFLKENPKIFLATMDKELKKKVSNSKIVVRAKKKIEIV